MKTTLVGEVKAIYQKSTDSVPEGKITSSVNAAEYLRKIWPEPLNMYESAVVLFLNRQNNIMGFASISTGGMTGTVIDPRKVFVHALLAHATGIILAHNHPSGALKPSTQDIDITNKIKQGGKILYIELLDHLIITENGHYSLSDNGNM